MFENPILDEIQEHRRQLSEAAGDDLARIFESIGEREAAIPADRFATPEMVRGSVPCLGAPIAAISGESWHDPILEELWEARRKLAQ